jgi:hypothetical protein
MTEQVTTVDTKRIEHIAEARISAELQQAELLVAKPWFDREGTDLLVFDEMKDGVKFCRIQCKGRSLGKRSSSVAVPSAYVTNGFVVILCVLMDQAQRLYCFLASDICRWSLSPAKEYRLNIKRVTYEVDLSRYILDSTKIDLIKSIIRNAETSGEFRIAVHGSASIPLGPMQMVGRAFSDGGFMPDPPLDGFPRLAYSLSQWGDEVYTEDGKVSVRDAAAAFRETFDRAAVAARFGTTVAHISEAVVYAKKAGLLEIRKTKRRKRSQGPGSK